MKEIFGIFAIMAALIILWLNPNMLNGLVNTVKKPFNAWVKNPDGASEKYKPWMIDPDKIKKGASKTGDKVLDGPDKGNSQNPKDPGKSIRENRDPGNGQSAKDPGESSSGILVTKYRGKNDPGNSWKIGPDPGRAYAVVETDPKSSKKTSKPNKKDYTKFEFDAYAVAVQKAK